MSDVTFDLDLPPLHTGILDDAALAALVDDVQALATVIAVVPKLGPRQYAPERSVGLEEGVRLLADGVVTGLQLRYQYDGREWWDTLLRDEGRGYRLVRIAHPNGPEDLHDSAR